MNILNITNYKSKEFAELFNVSVKTLQRWDREKFLQQTELLLIEDIILMTNIYSTGYVNTKNR